MSELTLELHEWETKAFARKRKPALLAIEVVENDHVIIAGPASIVKRAMDTSIVDYLETDGFIRAVLHDPIPHKARLIANSILQKIWRKRK